MEKKEEELNQVSQPNSQKRELVGRIKKAAVYLGATALGAWLIYKGVETKNTYTNIFDSSEIEGGILMAGGAGLILATGAVALGHNGLSKIKQAPNVLRARIFERSATNWIKSLPETQEPDSGS